MFKNGSVKSTTFNLSEVTEKPEREISACPACNSAIAPDQVLFSGIHLPNSFNSETTSKLKLRMVQSSFNSSPNVPPNSPSFFTVMNDES